MLWAATSDAQGTMWRQESDPKQAIEKQAPDPLDLSTSPENEFFSLFFPHASLQVCREKGE